MKALLSVIAIVAGAVAVLAFQDRPTITVQAPASVVEGGSMPAVIGDYQPAENVDGMVVALDCSVTIICGQGIGVRVNGKCCDSKCGMDVFVQKLNSTTGLWETLADCTWKDSRQGINQVCPHNESGTYRGLVICFMNDHDDPECCPCSTYSNECTIP